MGKYGKPDVDKFRKDDLIASFDHEWFIGARKISLLGMTFSDETPGFLGLSFTGISEEELNKL